MLIQNGSTRIGGEELIKIWEGTPESWIWVDLFNEPADTEQVMLTERFGLDPSAVAEAQRTRHPPSVDVYSDYTYLLLKPLDAESDSLDFNTLQLAMFASRRMLVTRRSKESPYLAKLWQTVQQNGIPDATPMSITVAMCRRAAERYGKVLLDLEQRLDVVEDELFERPSDALMKELVGYNTGLRKMNRILNYYVNIFGQLRQDMQTSGSEYYNQIDDTYALIERFESLCAMYQQVITDLIDAYISLNGHHLNQIMKLLTIVTVIFVPLSLLVGVYGMNFEYMPELKNPHGYFILLSAMLGIVVLLMFLFRRLRWL